MKPNLATSSKSNRILSGLVVGLTVLAIVIALTFIFSDSLKTLIIGDAETLLGKIFSIQAFMWFALGFGLGDLLHRFLIVRGRLSALKQGFLPDTPEQEKRVLTSEDMPDIYRSVKDVKSDLAEIITSLSLRFQAGKSVEQTHELLSSQMELWQYRVDLDYNLLKYVTWLIPTIGFIGTVVGISEALSFAGSGAVDPTSDEFLPAVTAKLGVAFETTLLALIMSALLVFLINIVQEREERTVEATGRYCLDNLITRLYVDSR